jgi:AsmA protein
VRRALFGLAALVAMGTTTVLIVPLFVSSDDVRDKLFSELEDATGYRLSVSGPVDISMFPFLDLVAENVEVAAQTPAGYREIATAERLRFGLSLAGLLSGNVRMTEITLDRPVITVPEPDFGFGAETGATTTSPAKALAGLSIDRLSIEHGTVILPDRRLEDVALTASLASLEDPLTLDLALRMDGQPYRLSGSIDAFGQVLDGKAAPVALSLEAPGTLAEPVAIDAIARYADDILRLDSATFTTGGGTIEGSVSAAFGGDLPQIAVSLTGKSFNIDALPAKAATGPAAAGGGMDHQIDLSPLRNVIADVDVSVDRLAAGGVAISPLVASARIAGGKLDAVADLIGIGGATGAASLKLDGTRDTPFVTGSLRISGVDVATLAEFAPAELPLTGMIATDIAFATAGQTLGEWKSRINASGSVTLADGRVRDIGLAEAIGDPKADAIEAVTLTARFDDLIKPVSLSGQATWRGEPFDLTAKADVRGFLADRPSAFEGTAAGARVTAGFDGTLSPKGQGSGRILLETPSLSGLMRWLGREPSWQSGFETFAIEGNLTLGKDSLSFADATIRLDASRGTGAGEVTLGARPRIEARLDLETLDLNPYLGEAGASPGAGAPAGWSDQPIDFSMLKAVDAKLSVFTKSLIYKQIKTGPVGMSAEIAHGRLTADLPDLKLYQGTGTGHLSVDASLNPPAQSFRFALSDLDAYPFLKDALGFGRIEGTGFVSVDLTGSGASQRAIVSSLNGSARFEFADGAIRGINVAKLVRSLTSGTLAGWQQGEAEKTDFAELSAEFAVETGKATTENLYLVGPLVRMTGAGSVDMASQSLQFRVDPKVVASLEGQGGKKDLEGLGVPVIVAGPWTQPAIYPDIAGILQDPAGAYDRLRALGGGLFKLPEANPVVAATDLLKQKTGISVGNVVKDGKVDTDALQQEAMKGITRLLQGEVDQIRTGSIPAEPDEPEGKRGKKSAGVQKPADQKSADQISGGPPLPPAVDPTVGVAQQFIQGLFGNKW